MTVLHDLVKTMAAIMDRLNEMIRLVEKVERSSTILSQYGSNLPPRSRKIEEPPRPARLAEASICDRSRPAHLFIIYDEYGEILCDDC